MPERKRLEMELNKPVVFELQFDTPLEGQSKKGKYHLYGLKDKDNNEYSFFAADDAHDKLKLLKSGDKVELTKLSQRNGKKEIIKYDVKLLSKKEESKEKLKDSFYDIMFKSYIDALKIQENLNGMVDVNRIAITLFIARAKF